MSISELANESFRRITNRDLDPVAVVAQCLDNQWVPADLLATMVERGWSLTTPGVAKRKLQDSRHEYLRALLNSQQVIVNRAFFGNNRVVYQDFLQKGSQRTAFQEM